MKDLPDAPWIREAELYGMPEPRPCRCPVCGSMDPATFIIEDRHIVGCEMCRDVRIVDAADWAADHEDQLEWGCDV